MGGRHAVRLLPRAIFLSPSLCVIVGGIAGCRGPGQTVRVDGSCWTAHWSESNCRVIIARRPLSLLFRVISSTNDALRQNTVILADPSNVMCSVKKPCSAVDIKFSFTTVSEALFCKTPDMPRSKDQLYIQ